MDIPNIVINILFIADYFCGSVSIASVPIAGHYASVKRTGTEDAYLIFSTTGLAIAFISLILFIACDKNKTSSKTIDILLLVKSCIYGISMFVISIICCVYDTFQTNGDFQGYAGTGVYWNYNKGAFAAAAFFGFVSVIISIIHALYSLRQIVQTPTSVSSNQSPQVPQQPIWHLPQQPIWQLPQQPIWQLPQQPIWQLPPPQRPSQTNPSSNIYRYNLPITSLEFNKIKDYTINSIQNHPGKLYKSFEIVKIERLFNDAIRKRYEQRKFALEQTNNGDANESLLFHGSSSIENIIDTGFNINYANARGMFGKGIYFASNSSKSDQYTADCQHPQPCKLCERYLLCCRVCLGKTKVEHNATNYNSAPAGFDSVSGLPGGGLNFPEYIVYRDDQAYAEYKITYKYT